MKNVIAKTEVLEYPASQSKRSRRYFLGEEIRPRANGDRPRNIELEACVVMPAKLRDYGYRTSIQIPDDVERLIQRSRAAFKKRYGYQVSRSAIIAMALRGFFDDPDWINVPARAASER